MSKDSKIEWTHHTFNPWWGCVKVSPACKNCYADTWSRRVGHNLWGAKSPRRFFGENHWREPIKWNEQAARNRERYRVFCASMADVFETRKELNEHRYKLWELIEETPYLDWLILTKRPQNISIYSPWEKWPPNVWLGTTAETNKWARERIDHLAKINARIHFISAEPLLGSIDLTRWLSDACLDWVIAGGESGPRARPTRPSWIRELRDQCNTYQVPFHFKQWGHWTPDLPASSRKVRTINFEDENGNKETLFASGKKAAGRQLDGRNWDGVPVNA